MDYTNSLFNKSVVICCIGVLCAILYFGTPSRLFPRLPRNPIHNKRALIDTLGNRKLPAKILTFCGLLKILHYLCRE